VSNFLRVAKPVAVIAGVWALGWGAVGAAFGVLLGLMAAAPLRLFIATVLNVSVGFTILGFAAGVVFSLALTLLERNSPADQLTTSRVAVAGAIGGALLPTLMAFPWIGSLPAMVGTVVGLTVFGLLGVATSLGLLKLLGGSVGAGAKAGEPIGAFPRES
jgi:hypothetical protein